MSLAHLASASAKHDGLLLVYAESRRRPLLTELCVTFASLVAVEEDGDYWLLLRPLVYDGARDRFVVPAGFRTDFASVPHALTWLVPRTGKHNRAAVLHDYLTRNSQLVTRKDADGIFLRVLRELGVGLVRRRLLYWGVRLAWHLRL